jgi:prolyl oligopeptidase PreP (S9A serine peptidase family)
LSLSADGGDAACLREYDLDAHAFVAEGFQLPPGKHSVTWRDPDRLYAAVVLSEADATASGYPREVKLWQRGQPFAQAHSLLKAEHRALAVSAWRMLNPDGGEPVELRAGDAVLFPENCEGVWDIRETLRKTYVLF